MTKEQKEAITGMLLIFFGATIYFFGDSNGNYYTKGIGDGIIFTTGFLGFQDLWTGKKDKT